MWSEGKFKSRDSALLGTISSDLCDVVMGILLLNSSLSSLPDCHHLESLFQGLWTLVDFNWFKEVALQTANTLARINY